MAFIQWSSPAFFVLEQLPPTTAFRILRLLDLLYHSPLAGHSMEDIGLPECRQIIYRSKYRIIYEYDELDDCVRILAIRDCRQRVPAAEEIRFRPPDAELPLE